jgi:hypothetical protein
MSDFEYSPEDTEPPREDGYVAFVWERHFFNAYLTKYGTITQSAEAAGVSVEMVEERARESEVFSHQMELCRQVLRDQIRHEVIRRALEPEKEPIISHGRIIAYKDKWDNQHLRWVAERLLPQEFHIPSKLEGANSDGEITFRMELGPGLKDE